MNFIQSGWDGYGWKGDGSWELRVRGFSSDFRNGQGPKSIPLIPNLTVLLKGFSRDESRVVESYFLSYVYYKFFRCRSSKNWLINTRVVYYVWERIHLLSDGGGHETKEIRWRRIFSEVIVTRDEILNKIKKRNWNQES